MFRNTGLITNAPPDLTGAQCTRIRNDEAVGACVFAAEGRPVFVRVHDVGTGFGPPDDRLDAEIVVRLDSEPEMAFGAQLRVDEDEPARKGMLDLLRAAFSGNRRVRLDYRRTGVASGTILRVAALT
jgi:hypothetical protein